MARKEYLKVMFVREPMERLFSCYLDKVVQNKHKSLKHFRREILRKGRFKSSEESDVFLDGFVPTFEEFLNYILETPSFSFSSHWEPFWKQCHPCQVNYDVIGKLETAEEDFTVK